MTTATRIAHLGSLTGVRAFAVFLVFWHHATNRFDEVHSSGMVGVSLFYVISGFVMAWTDRRTDTAMTFYRKRFARIYPAYFVVFLLSCAWLFRIGDLNLTDLPALFLVQAWVPDQAIYFGAQAIFWSLSCEIFFYVVFPLIRTFTRQLNRNGLFALGGVATGLSITWGSVGAAFPDDTTQWAFVIFPPIRLPEFVVGVVIGTLVAGGWRPRISLWFSIPLATAAVVAAMFLPYPMGHYAITLIPFAILVLSLAVNDLEGRRSFMRWPWLVRLGVWSYCIYLVHGLVLWTGDAVGLRLGFPPIVVVLAAVPLSILAAWLLHVAVERPAERWLRPARRARLDDDAKV